MHIQSPTGTPRHLKTAHMLQTKDKSVSHTISSLVFKWQVATKYLEP